MKKTIILLSLLILAFSANSFAQKAKPTKKTATAKKITATELYKLLPNEYINTPTDERESDLIFPNKIKSDYLKFMLSGENVPNSLKGGFAEPEGLGDLRVFHGKSRVFVGLRYQLGDANAENPSVDSIKITAILLEYKDGKFTDVTASMLPKISIEAAHKSMSENDPEVKINKEDVWIETQILEDLNGFMLAGRVKGSYTVSPLKTFKWDGIKFVESEE